MAEKPKEMRWREIVHVKILHVQKLLSVTIVRYCLFMLLFWGLNGSLAPDMPLLARILLTVVGSMILALLTGETGDEN